MRYSSVRSQKLRLVPGISTQVYDGSSVGVYLLYFRRLLVLFAFTEMVERRLKSGRNRGERGSNDLDFGPSVGTEEEGITFRLVNVLGELKQIYVG